MTGLENLLSLKIIHIQQARTNLLHALPEVVLEGLEGR